VFLTPSHSDLGKSLPIINLLGVYLAGTTFYVGSWVFIADGLGGFNSHLIDPSVPKTSKAARRHEVDNFVDQLDEIPLLVHIKEVRNRPNFDIITPTTLFELEEDLDSLLEITRQDAIVDREAPISESQQDLVQRQPRTPS